LIHAIGFALAIVLPARADEITDQIDAARAEYSSGELRKAAQTLKLVITSIQEKMNLDLLTLLPEPLQGWRADKAQAESSGIAAMMTGTNLLRRYFRDDSTEEVEIGIMADSPLMPMMTMMLSSPMIMQANPDAKSYALSGWRGMIEHEEDSDSWEISLLVANKILVNVQSSGSKDANTVEAYLKAIDLAAIEKAFAN
jgi:hypothetical protein